VRVLALLLSFVLVQGPYVRAQALPPSSDQILSLYGGYLEALRAQAGIPGIAAAVVGDSNVLWAQSFGFQDIESSARTRADALFHFDGLTQLVTASIVIQCAAQQPGLLDNRIGVYTPSSPDANATVAQILTHTSGTGGNLAFNYNLERLGSLRFVVETCTGLTFRQAVRTTIERLGMFESVPGPDAVSTTLSNADIPPPDTARRYVDLLGRLAMPYAVNAQLVPTRSQYNVSTLGAAAGLISNVFDFAKFDLAVRNGLFGDVRGLAWRNPVNSNGQVLPHGMGWFVQTYNGEPVVWQYGVDANASSSLVLTLPNRNVTLILLANSDGLAKPSTLSVGDVTVSPFARVFLGLVIK
jgi:CubicO group peptidase (beta-lactamase class C family)